MLKGSLSEAGPLMQFIAALGIIMLLFLLFSITGTILAMVIFQMDIFSLIEGSSLSSDAANVDVLIFLQVVQTLGLFIIPSVVVAWIVHKNAVEFLWLKSSPRITGLCLSALFMVAAIPLINFVAEMNRGINLPEFLSGMENWMKRLEEQQESITEAFLSFERRGDFWKSFAIVAVLPAFGEELLFRGVIQTLLTRLFRNHHASIIFTSVLFSVVHFQFYGFIPRTLMGVFFGYMLVWSGSLWYPVIAHFANNGLAVWFYYLSHKGVISKEIENIGSTAEMAYLVIISLILTVFLGWLLYRNERKKITVDSGPD